MTCDPNHVDDSPTLGPDPVEPASLVEEMASAVERVRRMATNVFQRDAALFDDPKHDS